MLKGEKREVKKGVKDEVKREVMRSAQDECGTTHKHQHDYRPF